MSAVGTSQDRAGLVVEVEQVSARALSRLGARLYRMQRLGTPALSAAEWRRVWQAYGARRRPRVA